MAALDPELIRQMAVSGEAPVEAVVHLRHREGSPAPPEDTERLAHELITRSKKISGERQSDVNVFRYLHSFSIVATPKLIKVLISQPEVASAVANRQPGSGFIPPVAKRKVSITEVGRRKPLPTAKRPPAAARKK